MPLSHEHLTSKMPAKIQIYILSRAELLITLCYIYPVNSMMIFYEDFFEVLHISVGQKMKILETWPDFLTFSAKTQNRF